MKLRFWVVCLAVSFLLIVPGCHRQKGMSEESVTDLEASTPRYDWGDYTGHVLTVWGRPEAFEWAYIKRAFQRYDELTGNSIETVPIPADEFVSVVSEALRSGNGPDIVLGFGGTNIEAFDPDDRFYDFSDAPWVSDLADIAINQSIYHGRIVGLPHWEASISGTLYNKKLFKKFGITPPTNQSEFMQACDTLLRNGITPFYLPCASPTLLLYQFPLDTIVEDDAVLEGLNNGSLGYPDLPDMVKVIEWYRFMAERGYLGDDYELNDFDGMGEALNSGRYAMALGWDTWLYLDGFQGNPSDFGLMPAFIGIPDEGTFEGPNLSLLMVNKESPKVDVAVDFITFLADPYNYNVAFAGINTAPVFKGQLTQMTTPQYVEVENWIEQNYHDSTAWLRIRGFSQSDATCIVEYMRGDPDHTAERCLREMEALRRERMTVSDEDVYEED